MKKSVIAVTFVMCILMALLAGCGTSATQQSTNPVADTPATSEPDSADKAPEYTKLNLSYTTFQNENAYGNTCLYMLQDKINERMDGAIQFDYFYSGTLASNMDTLDAVINGAADMGYVTVGNYPGRLPLVSLFDQCGIAWNNTSAGSSALKEFIDSKQPEELSEVVVMFCTVSTPGCIASSVPIRTVDDMQGMSIRSTSTTTAAVNAIGANAITIEWSECYEALRSGMVDGVYTTFGPCSSSLLQEVAPYCTVNPFYATSYLFVMNRSVFEQMTTEQQELFIELCDEVQTEYCMTYNGEYDGHADTELYFREIELIFFDENELGELESRVSHLIDDYAAQLDAQGYDGTGSLEYMKELAEKYNAMYPASDYNAYLQSLADAEG